MPKGIMLSSDVVFKSKSFVVVERSEKETSKNQIRSIVEEFLQADALG